MSPLESPKGTRETSWETFPLVNAQPKPRAGWDPPRAKTPRRALAPREGRGGDGMGEEATIQFQTGGDGGS